eukprot:PhM_4_TR10157/c0_g1_i2/m.7813
MWWLDEQFDASSQHRMCYRACSITAANDRSAQLNDPRTVSISKTRLLACLSSRYQLSPAEIFPDLVARSSSSGQPHEHTTPSALQSFALEPYKNSNGVMEVLAPATCLRGRYTNKRK